LDPVDGAVLAEDDLARGDDAANMAVLALSGSM
jgi:hypothetical protein